jgi:hypothetical protein
MACDVGLTRLPEHFVFLAAGRQHRSLSLNILCERGEAIFQRVHLFEAASFEHDVLLFRQDRNATAFSSPADAKDRAVMSSILNQFHAGCHFYNSQGDRNFRGETTVI